MGKTLDLVRTAFDSAIGSMGLQRKSIGPFPADKIIWKSLRELMGEQGSVLSQPYRQNIWIYAAVNAIATNISRVPFRIKKDIGAGLSKTIEEGPIYELFQNPNPLMSQTQLIEATLIFLGLFGEAVWILEGREDPTKVPKEIWTFNPTRFKPVQDKRTGMILGWDYENGNSEKPITLLNREIIFFKYFNPYDDIRGLAPTEPAKESVNQDYYAGRYNTAFFKNGATVDGYISVEGELTDEQFNRILKQFEDRHKGADKAHKIALLEGGGKFTQAAISRKDMEFIEGKKMTKQEILAAYKVNEVVLGDFANIKSYAGITAADKAFWEECLMPKTHYIEEHLWAKLFSNIGQRKGKGKIWGEFDLATVGSLQVNFDEKITTASKMFTMGWPINAINRRLELGMEDVEWGDQWWVPGGYLPAAGILNGAFTPNNATPNPGKDTTPKSITMIDEIIDEDKALTSISEIEFRGKLKKFTFEIRKKVLASVYDDEFVRPDISRDFCKLRDSLTKSYRLTITSIVSELGNQSGSEQKADVYDPEVQSFIAERIDLLVEGFAGVIEEMFVILEKSTRNKDEAADKIRIIFNALTHRTVQITKSECEKSVEFGKSLFFKKTFGNFTPSPSLLVNKG